MQNLLRLVFLAALVLGALSVESAFCAPPEMTIPAQNAVASDMETVKARLLAAQIPTEPQALQTLATDATKARDTLGSDGKWLGLDYQDPGGSDWGPSRHVENVLIMTRAYATPGQALYGDAGLLTKIYLGLDTFFEGNYRSANWWYNDIGVPSKMGVILLLLEGSLSPHQKELGMASLKLSADDKPMRGSTGANLSWLARVQLMRGLLLPSPELVGESFDVMWSEIKISPQGADGIQADNSFHQHGPLIYNGGYATSFVSDATAFRSYALGTRFALPEARERILIDFLLDGQDWMARGGDFDPGTRGRGITRDEGNVDKPSTWRQTAAVLAQTSHYRRDELLEMAHRQDLDGRKLVGNRNFWDSDFMVQHREGYYTSVRTHSTRTRNTDGASKGGGPINREGRLSHHVADGATYIWRRGDEYRGIFPVWNWNLVPGTTAEQVPALDQTQVAFKGGASFVGGVSDGRYGAATMDLNRAGLRAQKSWFYFDDEFVALGAGISATSDNPVLTSVNQSLLNGEVRVSNVGIPLKEGEHDATGARWVLHDGTGYIFPTGSALHVANKGQSGRWSDIGSGSGDLVSKDVFTLYLDHGAKPQNASYQYIVVPNSSVEDLKARVGNSALETLSNTPNLQAVRHNKLKILQAVFHRAGRLAGAPGWNVAVDQPCLLMVRERADGIEVSVSNPDNKPLNVHVEIDRQLSGEGATRQGQTTILHFELPDGLFAGSSATHILNKE